jgi:hypothetical protein
MWCVWAWSAANQHQYISSQILVAVEPKTHKTLITSNAGWHYWVVLQARIIDYQLTEMSSFGLADGSRTYSLSKNSLSKNSLSTELSMEPLITLDCHSIRGMKVTHLGITSRHCILTATSDSRLRGVYVVAAADAGTAGCCWSGGKGPTTSCCGRGGIGAGGGGKQQRGSQDDAGNDGSQTPGCAPSHCRVQSHLCCFSCVNHYQSSSSPFNRWVGWQGVEAASEGSLNSMIKPGTDVFHDLALLSRLETAMLSCK